ncbi:hypothetical protein [Treponema pedis]|uniref:hypothetical protein n=1 Tax=Treponema pedis TaxID=409322 RepID=UPI00197F158D|nr:hypothetical protein [Treponema pedis]
MMKTVKNIDSTHRLKHTQQNAGLPHEKKAPPTHKTSGGVLDKLKTRPIIYLPLAACRLPLAACRLPLAACRLPLAACRLPLAACRLPLAACRLPLAACRLPLAACRLPLAACRLPLAACRLPLAACRLPLGIRLPQPQITDTISVSQNPNAQNGKPVLCVCYTYSIFYGGINV